MEKYRVRGEWLVDDNDDIVYKSLRYWFQYYNLVPIWCNGEHGERVFCGWYSLRFNCRVAVWGAGGYGVTKRDFEDGVYIGKLFFVGNADLDTPAIRLKY